MKKQAQNQTGWIGLQKCTFADRNDATSLFSTAGTAHSAHPGHHRPARRARLAHQNHPRARLLSLVIGRKRRRSCSSTTNTHQHTPTCCRQNNQRAQRDALPHLGPTLPEPPHRRPIDHRPCPRHGAERNLFLQPSCARALASGYRFRKKRPPCPRRNFHHASGRYAR